jgi:hypothetical protein
MLTTYGSISEYDDTFYSYGSVVFTPLDVEERQLFINCIKIAEKRSGKKLSKGNVMAIAALIINRS